MVLSRSAKNRSFKEISAKYMKIFLLQNVVRVNPSSRNFVSLRGRQITGACFRSELVEGRKMFELISVYGAPKVKRPRVFVKAYFSY